MNRALPGLRRPVLATAIAAALTGLVAANAAAQTPSRPNILVIMADDIGYANVGIYSHGMMVPTPNIDRIGREGILFTDHYGHPSSTAGRAAFKGSRTFDVDFGGRTTPRQMSGDS